MQHPQSLLLLPCECYGITKSPWRTSTGRGDINKAHDGPSRSSVCARSSSPARRWPPQTRSPLLARSDGHWKWSRSVYRHTETETPPVGWDREIEGIYPYYNELLTKNINNRYIPHDLRESRLKIMSHLSHNDKIRQLTQIIQILILKDTVINVISATFSH